MATILRREPRPDGVFCFNDQLAIGAIIQAVDSGWRVPEDIAVIGCGNLHYDDSLLVPLSSVDQHSRRIGEETARIALTMANATEPPQPETVVLQPQLVVRASTKGSTLGNLDSALIRYPLNGRKQVGEGEVRP